MDKKYMVSTDKSKLDIEMICDYLLNHSYWARNRTCEQVKQSIENSICFALYDEEGRQCAFARVVSDKTVFAYIMDVFVVEGERGKGVGSMFVKQIVEDEALKNVQRFQLDTLDAHSFYAKFGFDAPKFPQRAMQKRNG